jgi:hypothetical protein
MVTGDPRILATACDFVAAQARGDHALTREIALATDPYELAVGLSSLTLALFTERHQRQW